MQKIPLALTCVVLLSGGFLAYQRYHNSNSSKTPSQTSQLDLDKKKAITQEPSSTTGASSDKTTPNSTYTTPTGSDTISITANKTDSDHVTVTTKLKGYSDGKCTLTITNGTSKTELTADVIYQSEFSTCAGFSVPISSVSSGTWNLTLAVTSGSITNTNSITYKVE